jgi:pyrophosphatase PpaX
MADSNLELGKVKGLLFDLDGTLLDSFPAHFMAYQAMFARFDIHVTEERFLNSYSPNWYHTYEEMGLPRESWEAANLHWLEEAAKRPPELFAGVPEMLSALQNNYALGLVTSGSRRRVANDLERTGLFHFFQAVVTGDDADNPKPAPDGLHLALRVMGLEASEAVYVGDAHADYEMARAAGVAFLGVASAFTNLISDPPYLRMNSITELPELLR